MWLVKNRSLTLTLILLYHPIEPPGLQPYFYVTILTISKNFNSVPLCHILTIQCNLAFIQFWLEVKK